LTNMLLEGLSELDNVTVYGPKDVERMVGVVSAVVKGVDPARVSALLDQEYGIATRPGCTVRHWHIKALVLLRRER